MESIGKFVTKAYPASGSSVCVSEVRTKGVCAPASMSQGTCGYMKSVYYTSSPAPRRLSEGSGRGCAEEKVVQCEEAEPRALAGCQPGFPDVCAPNFQWSRLLLRERKHSDPSYDKRAQE